MINCRTTVARLVAHAEKTLDGSEASLVAAHLLSCRACHRLHARIREGLELAAHLPVAIAGAPTWEELAPRLDQQEQKALPPWRDWLRRLGSDLRSSWALATAAAAALLLLGAGDSLGPLEQAALAAHQVAASHVAGDAAGAQAWIRAETGLEVPLAPGLPALAIEGALRLDANTAAVAARLGGTRITLTVTREGTANEPETFSAHHRLARRRVGDLELVTWTRGGQSFTLVSTATGSGERACVLCHDNRPSFEPQWLPTQRDPIRPWRT